MAVTFDSIVITMVFLRVTVQIILVKHRANLGAGLTI